MVRATCKREPSAESHGRGPWGGAGTGAKNSELTAGANRVTSPVLLGRQSPSDSCILIFLNENIELKILVVNFWILREHIQRPSLSETLIASELSGFNNRGLGAFWCLKIPLGQVLLEPDSAALNPQGASAKAVRLGRQQYL